MAVWLVVVGLDGMNSGWLAARVCGVVLVSQPRSGDAWGGHTCLPCHLQVATREDPASARRGESLYAFIPRSVWGNLVDGVEWERKRMRARGIPALSPRNRWGPPRWGRRVFVGLRSSARRLLPGFSLCLELNLRATAP